MKSLRVLFFLSVAIIFSLLTFNFFTYLDSSQDNQEEESSSVLCLDHNFNCDSMATSMGMSLDEYHEWQAQLEESIQQEDEMTDENGDIVDPNSTICNKCGGTGKIIIGCPGLNTGFGHFKACDNGYRRCGNNCRRGNDGWYYLKNGEICNRCDENGNEKCGICAGMGDSYYEYCENCNRTGKIN